MKDLIIKVTGAVQESNLESWKESALTFIGGINTTLVTDQDFIDAADNIKACADAEKKLDSAKEEIVNQTLDIATALKAVTEVQEEFRKVRLSLAKKEKEEKTKRKNETIADGYSALSATYARSAVAFHLGNPDKNLIVEAIKGKRTFTSMDKAILEVIEAEKERISAIETVFHSNIILFEDVEPKSLFLDKMNLALKSEDEVRAIIDSRIAKYELEQKEIAERERLAKEEAERLAKEVPPVVEEKVEQTDWSQPKPEQNGVTPPTPHGFVPPPPPSFLPRTKHIITVVVTGSEEVAIALAKGIQARESVESVQITRTA